MNFLQNYVKNMRELDPKLKEKCDQTFEKISASVQREKLSQNMIFDEWKRTQILSSLMLRPVILADIANKVDAKVFAEVGTAQGLQSKIFADLSESSRVYTCDIKDDRHTLVKSCKNINFVAGDSLSLRDKIRSDNQKVDFCWVDGSHDHYAVLDDFLSLFGVTNPNAIWAFDDFDKRFGCFNDLNVLSRHFDECVVVELGLTASGNPNRIMLARGIK